MSTRTALGTATTAGATTLSVSISTAINAHEAIFVGIGWVSDPGAISGNPFDGSNTYVAELNQGDGSHQRTILYRVLNANSRVINTNITINWTNNVAAAMWVTKWNLTATAAFDKSATNSQSNAAPSIGPTATLSQAIEVAMCVINTTVSGTPFSAATGGFTIGQTVSTNVGLAELFQETASNTALTAGCTLNASANWWGNLATYSESAAATVSRIPNVPTIPTIPTVGSLA